LEHQQRRRFRQRRVLARHLPLQRLDALAGGLVLAPRHPALFLGRGIGLLAGRPPRLDLLDIQALAPAVLTQLCLTQASHLQHHAELVRAGPLVTALAVSGHHDPCCSRLLAPSIQSHRGNAGLFRQFDDGPVQGRHHLPQHPFPSFQGVTRHASLPTARQGVKIQMTRQPA